MIDHRILRIIALFVPMLGCLLLAQDNIPTKNPHGDLDLSCAVCHTATDWNTVDTSKFDHSTTGFALFGNHFDRECTSCHQDLTFKNVGTTCNDCHTDIHQGRLGNDCITCHDPQGWDNRIPMVAHHQNTLFPLVGAHAAASCEDCHINQQRNEFSLTPIDCQGCHLDEFANTQMPNHILAGFPTDCQVCHQVTDTSWELGRFDHPPTFQLIGGHSGLDCASCHAQQFAGTPTDCVACHESDFQATLDPNHIQAGFSRDCMVCHNVNDWSPAPGFDHNQTQFPLTGAHMPLDCISCHEDGFAGTPSDCIACHQEDFNGVQDPNHVQAGFSTDCLVCHSTATFSPATAFDHNQTQFPLTGAHIPLDCMNCHENGFAGTPTDCIACHQEDFNGVQDPNHVEAGFPTDCLVCHTTNAWLPATFDHNQTQFPLTGAHIPLDCNQCHEDGFAGTPTDCIACHQEDFNGVQDPNHVEAGFPTDCLVCHTTATFSPATAFDHNQTQFPLTGAHIPLDCMNCHENGFAGTPTDCIACHQEDFNGVQDPNHVQAGFPTDCLICHTTVAFSPAMAFDHNQTQFPLTGAHMPLDCISCHEDGFAGTPTDCIACHQEDFNGVQDPNHVEAGFPTDCLVCHTTATFSPATAFDHNQTQFPLTGAHIPLDCMNCHENGFAGTPTDCIACHQDDFNGVQDPNHVEAGFPTDCLICHTTVAFSPAMAFDHNQTQFPLTGAHMPLDCISCHEDGFAGTPTDCIACHQEDFNGVQDPNHVEAGFPTDCLVCHTTNAWEPSTFDHNQTQFPLSGAHIPLDCNQCHENGFAGTPTDCIACHQEDFNGVQDPNHVEAGFPTDCLVCHTTNAWEPSTFDHNQTQFPLTGAHIPLDCNQCHENGFAGTPTDCIACHQEDFNGVQDPNHVQAGFPTDCLICHTTNAWLPATFDHNQTQFPLTGAHIPLDCNQCHENGFAGTPTDCIACHQDDFNGVQDPNHVQAGFPTDCLICHTTNAWLPATFDHNQTQFPLSGAHIPLDCNQCHENGFAGTPTDCIACHQEDFNGVQDPNHVQAGFPTDCLICHTTNAWLPATFDHNQTQFPLTGAHIPLECNQCHENGFVGTPTDCIACHQTDFNNTNDPDHVREGFPTDCLICHNTIAWEPSIFDHNQTAFPLTGEHLGEDCSECHENGYVGTPTDCFSCHQEDYIDADDPDHVGEGFPTDCSMCHNTNDWD